MQPRPPIVKTMREGTFVQLPSTEIHVVDTDGAGTPYVLVHGLGGNHTNWIEVFDPLAERRRDTDTPRRSNVTISTASHRC